ncbi:MAG: hypothetical protein Kow0040_02010 [Thermogutta sp.]
MGTPQPSPVVWDPTFRLPAREAARPHCWFPNIEMQPEAPATPVAPHDPSATENTVTVLTAQAAGAIAVIRLEGPLVATVVPRRARGRSGRPLDLPPGPRPRLVRWDFGGPVPEEAVLYRPSETVLEIHCHGGIRVVENLVRAASADGFVRQTWQDWLLREESDPIATAARIALAQARTTRTADILLDQYHGALRTAVQEIAAGLERGDAEAANRLRRLASRIPLGRHLIRPWQVVILGPPNAGKSSLLNALAGYGRALVHPMPGTTRDLVSAVIAADGWPIELIDTAGLRRAEHPVERLGVQKAEDAARSADLVILVFDRSQRWEPDHGALARRYPQALLLHNKSDLPAAPGDRPPGVDVSAHRPEDVPAILEALVERLVPSPPMPGEAIPFTEEQAAAVREALELLPRAGPSTAARRLKSLTTS